MSKKQKVIGISIFSVIGILLCLNIAFPMYIYDAEGCRGLFATGADVVPRHYVVYSIGFVKSNHGDHFLSLSEYKEVRKYIKELKGKMKEVKSSDIVCPDGEYGSVPHIKIGLKYYKIEYWEDEPDIFLTVDRIDSICR